MPQTMFFGLRKFPPISLKGHGPKDGGRAALLRLNSTGSPIPTVERGAISQKDRRHPLDK